MILTRLGNKRRIAKKILPHFPVHNFYIEPFFGAGGMFFSKEKAKYNYVNDNDDDVFNLFQVLSDTHTANELKDYMKLVPYHQTKLNFWKKNQETDSIKKAARFLFLSNYTFLGKGGSLLFGRNNSKRLILERIDGINDMLSSVMFANSDYLTFLKSLSNSPKELKKTFCYCDPPYLNTTNNYKTGFKEEDVVALFNALEQKGFMFAYSEFDHDFVLEQAKKRSLRVEEIGERRNINNRRKEVLIMNY